MKNALHHRGPDDSGHYSDEKVSLGFARLAIIDLSPHAHQPLFSAGRDIIIVYNGELYNYQSERKILEARGHTFTSTSDTEVVLRLYEEYGDEFLKRLRGMFALAIYDRRGGRGHERLLLARDPLGIKPLLYSRLSGAVVFASEIKALLASGLVARELDANALRLLLTFGSVQQPATIIKNVAMLPPGHVLVATSGDEFTIKPYWHLREAYDSTIAGLDYQEQVQYLKSALEESVRLHLIGDRPTGAFLSGGVDSSLLVAIMSKLSSRKVSTFSVGFSDEEPTLDESGDAARTANFIGTDHSHVVVTADQVRDRFSHVVSALDQPSVDGVNSYFVSQAASSKVTVALSGTGSDELFAGYPWFLDMLHFNENRLRRYSAYLLSKAFAFGEDLKGTIFRAKARDSALLRSLRRQSDFLSRFASNYLIFGAQGTATILAPRFARKVIEERDDLIPNDLLAERSTVSRVSGLCLGGYLRNQLLRDIDAASMAHSLEVRVPYLDIRVVSAALSLPDDSKISRFTEHAARFGSYAETGTKRILFDVGKGLLPQWLETAPKRGFSMPIGTWLRRSLKTFMRDVLSVDSIRASGIFNVEETQRVLDGFLAGSAHWTRPWLLLMVECWAREVLAPTKTSIQ